MVKRIIKLIKFLIVLAFLLALVGGFAGYWGYRSLTTPHAHTANQSITIEQGLGRRAIIDRLVVAGVLENRWPLLGYMLLRPQESKLQAGTYEFESPITPLEVLAKLRQGSVVKMAITIPEGYDKFDILETLAATNLDTKEAFQNAINDPSLIRDIDPEARNLEGYIFPDTYNFNYDTHAPQVIGAMVRRFRQILTPERLARAKELGLTFRQVLTLASLIEREAKVDDDRPLISAVFHNRLKAGMRLDCDPSFIYAAKLAGAWDGNVNNPLHRKRESTYNTYYEVGLPPGPIASPGLKSIDAALNPADAKYRYFVVDGTDGHHKFSVTEAEHNTAVAKYRQQQRNGK